MLQLEGMSTAKIVLFHQGSTELRRCENCVFFLPVNILTGVTRWLLGPHDTLPCILIWFMFVVCPASKPWGITYDIISVSTTVFSVNISWRAPNNTYQRDTTGYTVIIGRKGDELFGVELINDDHNKYRRADVSHGWIHHSLC